MTKRRNFRDERESLEREAERNIYDAGELANAGENHQDDDLPLDNSILYQDPSERLDRGTG